MVRTKRDIDRKWAKTAGKNGSDKCLMQGCYKLSIKKKKNYVQRAIKWVMPVFFFLYQNVTFIYESVFQNCNCFLNYKALQTP